MTATRIHLITRSSDGQLMFLVNKLAKMNHNTPLGSRIAEVHNGSSLFTGDAGQGESNIRRWIIENDWLEAIIALPLNMFYNTGIATYIWVLTNRKPEHRRGKVQLIDATAFTSRCARTWAKRTASYPTTRFSKLSTRSWLLRRPNSPESRHLGPRGCRGWHRGQGPGREGGKGSGVRGRPQCAGAHEEAVGFLESGAPRPSGSVCPSPRCLNSLNMRRSRMRRRNGTLGAQSPLRASAGGQAPAGVMSRCSASVSLHAGGVNGSPQ